MANVSRRRRRRRHLFIIPEIRQKMTLSVYFRQSNFSFDGVQAKDKS